MTSAQCPDCDVAMEIGYIPENMYGGTVVQLLWQSSTPEQSMAFGIVKTGSVEPSDGEAPVPIWAFRCPNCGLLRLHAIPASELSPA